MATLTQNKVTLSHDQIRVLAEMKSHDIDTVSVEACNHGLQIHGVVTNHRVMIAKNGREYLLFEIMGVSLNFHARFSTFMNAALECKNPLDGSSTILFLKDHICEGMLISGEISIHGIHKNLVGVTYLGCV